MTPPVSQVQVNTPTVPDTTSVITGAQTSTPVPNAAQPRTTSMAVVTPSPLVHGSTTSLSMDSGPNTLLCQLRSTALACTGTGHTPSTTDGESIHTMYNRHQYQIRHINSTAYCITQQTHTTGYHGTLVNSGANSGMAGPDTRVLSTIPHAHVDITGVGRDVMEQLPLVQCASVVDTLNEGKVVLIMLQYMHKPDAKTIHSKSQLEHFRGMVYDSAKATGGHQMVVTHEGYAIPLHVCNGLFYMDMSPASDLDMDLYPHVFLTTDSPLEPEHH